MKACANSNKGDGDQERYSGVSVKQEGHTLLEIVVVVVVMGILSALAGPNLLHLHARVQLKTVTEEIASELRLARQLARTHRDKVIVTFDTDRDTVETRDNNGMTRHHLYHYGNRGIVVDEPSGGPELLFYSSGRSATATTIWLRNKEGQVQRMTIGITGRVRIQ